jgi:hypothetical protein
MCVFKNHAFIYFLRPPSWSGTDSIRRYNTLLSNLLKFWVLSLLVYIFSDASLLWYQIEKLPCYYSKNLPLENVLKSIGYMDIVLFQTISNSDIYQPKSSGKSVTDFYPSIRKPEKVACKYWNWLLNFLNFSAVDFRLTNICTTTVHIPPYQ